MLIAITRKVSPNIQKCELTHLAPQPIDFALAEAQHGQYESCLQELGCQVLSLPAEPDLPDSVFVEDTAVVLDELALITRPGAESRRLETTSIVQALSPYRKLVFLEPPAILDGGDVLRIGNHLFVGLSNRSNQPAVDQMHSILAPFGYSVAGIMIQDCLHLKTAISQVSENTVLLNPQWVKTGYFSNLNVIEVDPSEPFGANALLIGKTVIYPAAFGKTRKRMEQKGISVRTVEATELAKAEGGVTCCSLVFHHW